MDYYLGAGLLFVACAMIAVGRVIVRRLEPEMDGLAYGIAEAFAFIATILMAFAVAEIGGTVLDDWSLAAAGQVGASLAVAGLATYTVWVALDRLTLRAGDGATSGLPSGPASADIDRRGRPPGSGGKGAPQKTSKRAA